MKQVKLTRAEKIKRQVPPKHIKLACGHYVVSSYDAKNHTCNKEIKHDPS